MIQLYHQKKSLNCFRKNLLRQIYKKIMTIDDPIRDEKFQFSIIRESARVSVLSSGNIDKCKYLTSKEKLPFNSK